MQSQGPVLTESTVSVPLEKAWDTILEYLLWNLMYVLIPASVKLILYSSTFYEGVYELLILVDTIIG